MRILNGDSHNMNQQENKIFDDWFNTLREWFYTAEDKNKWLSGDELNHGFVPIAGEILNPHRKKITKSSLYLKIKVTYQTGLKKT